MLRGKVYLFWLIRRWNNLSLHCRPHGDVTVRDARFRILDENNQLLPLHRLYNHHVYLLRGDPDAHLPNWDETDNGTQTYTRLDAIAVIGAEGLTSPGIQVPDGYGFLCPADDVSDVACFFLVPSLMTGLIQTWFLGVHFVNEWGIASGANITAFVEVDVYYTEGVDTAESVNSWIMELDKTIRNYVEFDVPGTGGPGSTVSHSNTFTWKRDPITIVRAIPHIHIGGIEGTLEDVTHNKVIAHGRATYSDDDYIIGVESVFPEYTIETGTQLKITSVYDNSHNYGSVMSLFLIYATGLDDLHYFSDSFGDRDDDDCEGAYSEELCDNINGSGPNDGDDQNTTDNEAPQTFADGANGDLIPEVGETDERDVAARESSATEVGKRQGEKIIQKSQ